MILNIEEYTKKINLILNYIKLPAKDIKEYSNIEDEVKLVESILKK